MTLAGLELWRCLNHGIDHVSPLRSPPFLRSASLILRLVFQTAGRLAFALSVLPAALAVIYDVQVDAGGELAYTPPYVNAVPGDVVNFIFRPKNHTVAQSSFEAPGVALPAQVVLLWSDRHCGQGGVFAIDPAPEGEARSFEAFRDLAITINGTASDVTRSD
ncbi:hypothetical protein CCMSSC00406_0008323 [Pleurotus cornucopiae]|uniref:Uncharacterized protein n=1 Tax=Pleurotus cornucopiae TaxID=5321 RepID=A0ACB7IWH8_PLECO|nr:hypothetical protein CCMSSC00406_0008323 [Pleurotus cornucopiae]